MTELQAGDAQTPGTYHVIQTTGIERTVDIGCPNCGKFHRLSKPTISPDGDVRPIVMCPCGFNDFVRLLGWQSQRAEYPTVRRGNPRSPG